MTNKGSGMSYASLYTTQKIMDELEHLLDNKPEDMFLLWMERVMLNDPDKINKLIQSAIDRQNRVKP